MFFERACRRKPTGREGAAFPISSCPFPIDAQLTGKPQSAIGNRKWAMNSTLPNGRVSAVVCFPRH